MPATNAYYTFAGEATAVVGESYTFTVTATQANCNEFVVLVNDVEVTGDNGTYTVENVSEALTIKVLHGYIEYGTAVTVTYEEGTATITNSTSTNNTAYMAYISADYVNYMMSQGYTKLQVYLKPDGTIANQAIVMCSENRVRTPDNYTAIAEIPLVADKPILFWCQKDGLGSAIQGQGGYMTVTGLTFVE